MKEPTVLAHKSSWKVLECQDAEKCERASFTATAPHVAGKEKNGNEVSLEKTSTSRMHEQEVNGVPRELVGAYLPVC